MNENGKKGFLPSYYKVWVFLSQKLAHLEIQFFTDSKPGLAGHGEIAPWSPIIASGKFDKSYSCDSVYSEIENLFGRPLESTFKNGAIFLKLITGSTKSIE